MKLSSSPLPRAFIVNSLMVLVQIVDQRGVGEKWLCRGRAVGDLMGKIGF
jgi:hypothetical protein